MGWRAKDVGPGCADTSFAAWRYVSVGRHRRVETWCRRTR